MSEPIKYVAVSKRPLRMAEALRAATEVCAIFQSSRKWLPAPEQKFFAGCVPVVCDSVSDWWDEQGTDKWPNDALEPLGRLPWPHVWVEWIDRNPERPTEAGTPRLYGARLAEHSQHTAQVLFDQMGVPMPVEWAQASIFIAATMFMQTPGGAIAGFVPIWWAAGVDGRAITTLDGNIRLVGEYDPEEKSAERAVPPGQWADATWRQLGVWRLFTAWMGVKNVEVTDTPLPRATRRQIGRVRDSGPPPWISYKTLVVTLPSSPRHHGQARMGLQQPIPFHLVRGHRADYTKGAGMFGDPAKRLVVWKPMHHRGLQRIGAIAKTYLPVIAENPNE